MRIEREEYLFGQQAALTVNTCWREMDRAYSAEEFMPTRVARNRLRTPVEPEDPLAVIKRLDAYAERNPHLPRVT